ncbi:uncharacterized protein [Typha angustifolia]|uniref:uncharacterized protein n=1 Tax=Typha angustifolia TaxID=59011 RepID=UPI003C2DCBC6
MEEKGKEEKEKKMEDYAALQKDTFITKPTRRYPHVLWIAVLALIMSVAVYVCSLCLKQTGFLVTPKLLKLGLTEKHCNEPGILESADPYVHYPEPSTYSRKECACTPVRSFAILSMQRSGSGWFETLLNSHVNISSNGEVFSVKDRRSNISSITKTLDKVYSLDWYSSASKNECTAAVGLKWMLNQGLMQNHKEIAEYFNQKGVFVIFLFRRNLLRRLVSVLANTHDRDTKQLNGTHKSHVHSRSEADILARYKPLLNTTLLIPELNHTDKWRADALQNFKNTRHIVLYYEDLIKNPTTVMDVLDFLRLPKRKLHSRHVKIHTRPLADQVENWDAIYDTLKGTKYESFLHVDYQLSNVA